MRNHLTLIALRSRSAPLTWRARLAVFLPLVWLVGAGCQTPNVKPFGDATVEVNSAVRQAYSTTLSRLDSYEAIDAAGLPVSRLAANHPANRFTNGWMKRLQVMEAMVSYSDSLVNIVDAGETSKANAKAISDQAAKLVEATPWGVYGDAAKSIFQEVHGLAVSVAQYHSIAKAVGKADESVQRVAVAVGLDLESVTIMMKALYDDQEEGIVTKKYNHHRGYVNALMAKQSEFENQLLNLRNSADGPRLALLDARVAGKSPAELEPLVKKLEEAETNQKVVTVALKECDELLARVAHTEKAYRDELGNLRASRHAAIQLAGSTRESIRLWAAAHKDLKAAIEENREPNIRLLVASALEIRATIETLKTHE